MRIHFPTVVSPSEPESTRQVVSKKRVRELKKHETTAGVVVDTNNTLLAHNNITTSLAVPSLGGAYRPCNRAIPKSDQLFLLKTLYLPHFDPLVREMPLPKHHLDEEQSRKKKIDAQIVENEKKRRAKKDFKEFDLDTKVKFFFR